MDNKFLNMFKNNLPFMFFLLCLGTWLSLSIYGAFSDPNVTVQEALNIWEENFVFHNNKSLFLFLPNIVYHQHLYHLLVYFITDSLGYLTPLDYIYVGRILSIIFGSLSIITALNLFKNYIKTANRYFLTSIIILHPLFFFYCFQAEPYAMLFFLETLQLLLYFKLGKNKSSSWLFLTISILGFFTHYFFLILLFAECVNEIICYIKNRKINFLPFFAILGLSIVISFQAPVLLHSETRYNMEGLLIFSWTIILKMLGILWGVIPVAFPDSIVYSLSIVSLIITFYFIFKNSGSIPKIILIYFIVFLTAFILQTILSFIIGSTYPFMRHYIHIILPLTIIIGISLNKYKKMGGGIIASILIVFACTNYKTINTNYKYDGLSVINYIHKKAEMAGHENYLTLINPEWAGYVLIDRNISFSYVYPYSLGQALLYNTVNLHFYKRPYIYQFRKTSIPPLFPDEYTPSAYALKYQIYLDSGLKINQFENFINQKSTNELLNNILQKRSCKLNHLEIQFLNNKDIRTYNKNRLLLEILYPQYIPNIIRRELRIEDKITNVIDTHPEISYFYLLYVNESILGIDYIDTTTQKTAINRMLLDQRLIFEETKAYPNVQIYTFARKKR
jgi:hypothetical protein